MLETNVPKLRFKEFEGEWVEKKLGSSLSFKNGINATKEQYGKGYKFINVLDIINNVTIKYKNIIGSVDVSKEIFEKNRVEYGNILFQRSSETREDAGQTSVYLDKEKFATFGGFVIRGQQKEDHSPDFMNYMFKTQHARKEITQKSNGSTRYNVSQETLSKVLVYLAPKPEQQKIANFLASVDKKIEQLTQKKIFLESYKKGVMEKIFSQEIRFENDDGGEFEDWEEKKLGEVSILTSSKRVYLSDYVKMGIPFYRGKEISELRLGIRPKDILYISEKVYEEYKLTYGVPQVNDLLITAVGTLGNVLRISDDKAFYFKDGNLIWIRNIKENSSFLEILLYVYKRDVERTSIGSTQKALTMIELRKIKLPFPCIEEQTKVANFLTSIDKRIEETSKQLEETKKYKKALLQQMFI